MERVTSIDRPYAVAAACARDLNDELTVILSSVSTTIRRLEPGHPARPLLLDLEHAALRCAAKTAGLLKFGVHRGRGVDPYPQPR